MFFLIGLIFLNMLVLGASFSIVIIGNFPGDERREFAPVRFGSRTFDLRRFIVGVGTSVLGLTWLMAHLYYFFVQPETAGARWTTTVFHVVLPSIAALGLLLGGYAILHQWKRHKEIFMASSVLLVATALFSILLYRTVPRDGIVTIMYLIDSWTLIIGGAFTTSVFMVERLVKNYDERLPPEKRAS